MSMTTQQTERELFEKFYCDGAMAPKLFEQNNGFYKDLAVAKAWTVWKAARAPLLSTIAQQGEALEAAQWRSMDSAPMDGTLVILYGDSFWTPGITPTRPDLFNLVVQGEFSGGHWQIGGRTLEAKMWMPLPNAPVTALISQKVEG